MGLRGFVTSPRDTAVLPENPTERLARSIRSNQHFKHILFRFLFKSPDINLSHTAVVNFPPGNNMATANDADAAGGDDADGDIRHIFLP